MTHSHKTITPQQSAFVSAYLTTGNAYQAAKQAGYAEATAKQATRAILPTAAVTAEMYRQRQAIEGAIEWNREEWLRRTARLFSNSEDSNPATAAKCLELLGRAIGVFQDTGLSDRERDAFAWLGRSMLQAASGEPQQLADGSGDSSSDGESAEHSDGDQRNAF